jgi:uncharacterized protein (DUF849 family)
MSGTWLEVALNGPWGEGQPRAPLTAEECIEKGVACVEAGAAIVHVHAYDPVTGEQDDDADRYARIVEGIQSEVDAIVYPTLPPAGAPGTPDQTGAERFAHQDELGDRGLLEWGAVDPGSVNRSRYDAVAGDEPGFLYRNPEAHARAGLEVAECHDSTPAYAIYEPGFVRLGAALADRYDTAPPVYRFMFTDDYTFGYPPEPYALESYLELLASEAGDVPWMVSGLGVDVTPLIEVAVERGGHVRVGLEDAPLGSGRTNVEWVEHARREIEAAGGSLATAAEVREAL